MKTTQTYNKASIMKAAWTLYRTKCSDFSTALKTAWWLAKKNIEDAKKIIICLTLTIEKETEKAYMFVSKISDKKFWAPKSSVTIVNGNFGFDMWIAREKNISPIF
jgi:hypothetical protein